MTARLLLAGLVFSCLGIGCGKQPSSSAQPEPVAQQAAPPPDTGTPPGQPGETVEPQAAPSLGELTQAVRKYAAERRRVPASLDELVAHGYLARVPPAPAGKKFVINKNLEVVLANP